MIIYKKFWEIFFIRKMNQNHVKLIEAFIQSKLFK